MDTNIPYILNLWPRQLDIQSASWTLDQASQGAPVPIMILLAVHHSSKILAI